MADDLPQLEPWVTPPSLISPPGAPAGPGVSVDRSGAFSPTVPLDTGAGVADASRQIILPVRVAKPPDSEDFNPGSNFAGVDTAASPFVVLSYTVPDGSVAYVKSFEIAVIQLLLTSDIVFALRVDGAPIPGWDNLQAPAASLSYYSRSYGPDETFIRIEPGKTLDMIVRVNDGGAYGGSGNLHGWIVPQQLADASDGAWR